MNTQSSQTNILRDLLHRLCAVAVLVPDTPDLNQMPDMPSLPTSTLPAQIRGLNMSGRFPMDMRAPPVDLRFCLSWALSDAETYYGGPPYMPDTHEQEGMHLRTWHVTLSSKDLHLVGIKPTTFSV